MQLLNLYEKRMSILNFVSQLRTLIYLSAVYPWDKRIGISPFSSSQHGQWVQMLGKAPGYQCLVYIAWQQLSKKSFLNVSKMLELSLWSACNPWLLLSDPSYSNCKTSFCIIHDFWNLFQMQILPINLEVQFFEPRLESTGEKLWHSRSAIGRL